ncbi:MAG TPA: hypothetical protein GX513_06760 [Firmicutes bacterium]|nr:hypothetical protein [Bacillota bacterium]
MRAVVCVRPVPVQSQVIFSMGAIDGTEAERELTAAEANAIALVRGLGAEITALTWSGPEGEATLRQALALGAAQAVRLHRDDPLSAEPWLDPDPGRVVQVLAAYLAAHPAELVLCGAQSGDQGRGAVGPMLAEALSLPAVTWVIGARREEEGLVVVQQAGERRCTWQVPVPALLTVSEDAPRPGKPSLLNLAKAMRAPLQVLEAIPPAPTLTAHALTSAERRRPQRERLVASDAQEACQLLIARLRERRVI